MVNDIVRRVLELDEDARAETFTGEATGRNLFDVSAHQAPTVCMDGGMYFVSGVSFQPPSGHHLASRRT